MAADKLVFCEPRRVGNISIKPFANDRPNAVSKRGEVQVSLRIYSNGAYYDAGSGLWLSPDLWIALCKKPNTNKAMRTMINAHVERAVTICKELVADGRFSLPVFRERWKNLEDTKALTLPELWKEMAEGQKRLTTRKSQLAQLRRFLKDYPGGKGWAWEQISAAKLSAWKSKLMADGLSAAYIALLFKNLRSVFREAVKRGWLKADVAEMLRGVKVDDGLILASRRDRYLTAEEWGKLWQFYVSRGEGTEAEKWNADKRAARLEALGYFLWAYLGAGQNLMDTILLRYGELWKRTNGEKMCFDRSKTSAKTAGGAHVEFYVSKEMKTILDRQGNKPSDGARVFPILAGRPSEHDVINGASRLGQRVTLALRYICPLLGIAGGVSATWARHSYATVSVQGGVSQSYVSWSLGHSESRRGITMQYISYSDLATMKRNHAVLLPGGDDDKAELTRRLSELSAEELRRLLASVGK